MLTRADIERIIEVELCKITVEITAGGFTDPNSRKIEVKYGHRVLCYDYFDIVQRDEYEG
jgi:hypothetical protein